MKSSYAEKILSSPLHTGLAAFTISAALLSVFLLKPIKTPSVGMADSLTYTSKYPVSKDSLEKAINQEALKKHPQVQQETPSSSFQEESSLTDTALVLDQTQG